MATLLVSAEGAPGIRYRLPGLARQNPLDELKLALAQRIFGEASRKRHWFEAWSGRETISSVIVSTCANNDARERNQGKKTAGKPLRKQAAVSIAIGLALMAAPPAHADGDWMAEAISDSTGKIQVVYTGSSQQAAEKQVMDTCRKTISDCRLLASGEGGCIALAMPPARTRYFGGWGPTREEAEAAAAANSLGGTVLKDHTHCAGDPTG